MKKAAIGAVMLGAIGCATGGDDSAGKAPPVWIDGYAHQLVIKFADGQLARQGGDGKLDTASGDDDRLASVLGDHGLAVRPILRLPDAKVDAIGQLSSEATDLRGIYSADASTDRDGQLAAAHALLALDTVEYVYLEPIDVPPPGDIAPATESYVSRQTYRGAEGIDAVFAATLGATGAGVRLADVEYGWTYAHEDLVDRDLHPEPGQTISPTTIANGWEQHGTAVIGETSAVPNSYGMTGLVPDADVFTYPERSVERGSRRVEAIAAAVAGSRPGDVVLLEMQTVGANGQYGPAEYNPAVWQVVKAATDAGIIVVAAAGNGNEDLDSAGYAEYRARGDSGAIIVGAASHDRRKMSFSTHGSRVDLHGWGTAVATLGYGRLIRVGGDLNQAYTDGFSGTSSASPIVASACVAIQSYARAQLGRPLAPRELRDLLVQTGSPQADPESGRIGPLPNLRAALEQLGQPPPPPPPPGALMINEILADPPVGYDASGDGVASTTGDEFVELINTGGTALDLAGATISDSVGVRVTLPAGTLLPPGGVLVVFGGGAVGPGLAGVQTVSLGTLALNNTGDRVTIAQAGTTLATASYGADGGLDQSLVRAIERDAASALVRHRTLSTSPASPGKRANGSPL
jgi:hypothetical protein